MDCFILQPIAIILLFISVCFICEKYIFYINHIETNTKCIRFTPVKTKTMTQKYKQHIGGFEKLLAPYCNFRQYLRYLWLAYLPYVWSVPIKISRVIYFRQFRSELSEHEKRKRLAKIVLETSVVLGFHKKEDRNYVFKYHSFLLPSRDLSNADLHFINECVINISLNDDDVPVLINIVVDGTHLQSINKMFSFLHMLFAVYTHTLTHDQAANIAEFNTNIVKHRLEISEDFKQSIDDMHAAVSGINEAANYYPADIWSISRKHLAAIIGHNSVQQICNHETIAQCSKISEYVNFTMKARKVFSKYLGGSGISISTLAANTIFHSIDHYNMDKYFLYDSEEKYTRVFHPVCSLPYLDI